MYRSSSFITFAHVALCQVVKQRLAHSVEDAIDFFVSDLEWKENRETAVETKPISCVVKPYVGVASDGVYKCSNIQEITEAFKSLHGKPRYGGGINEALLVQECVDGTEYAVDTVSMNGITKIVALWKYKKYSLNDAPFVYQCSELVSSAGDDESTVCDYCEKILEAEGIKWGPTHTGARIVL